MAVSFPPPAWRSRLESLASPLFADRRMLFAAHALGYAALYPIHSQVPRFADGRFANELLFDHQAPAALVIAQGLVLVYLCGLYLLGLACRHRCVHQAPDLIAPAAGIAAIAWCVPPAQSADLFCYIASGRLVALYGLNPYLHSYGQIADGFSPYAWFAYPMAYGPLNLPAFALAGVLSEWGVDLALYGLKLVWLLVHCANLLLLARVLRRAGFPATEGFWLFAFNPLVLLELITNGHNDGLLLCGMLLALAALQGHRPALALWLALLASLVKLPGLALLAALVALLVRQGQWVALARGAVAGLTTLAVSAALFFPEPAALANLLNPHGYAHNALAGLALRGLVHVIDRFGPFAAPLAAVLPGLYSLAFLGFCLWRLARVTRPADLPREVLVLLFAWLLAYGTQFFPWYVTWLLPFAALTDVPRLRQAAAIFSCSVLAFYAFPKRVFDLPGIARPLLRVLQFALAFGPPVAWLARWRPATPDSTPGYPARTSP
jgi:hypothetical protein